MASEVIVPQMWTNREPLVRDDVALVLESEIILSPFNVQMTL